MCFVYHGSLDNIKSVGTNRLIQEFAKLVVSSDDIVKNYKFLHKTKNKKIVGECQKKEKKIDIKNCVPEEFKNIYNVIGTKPIDINEIVKLSNESMQNVMAKLTLLELEGKIEKNSGNRYKRCYKS